jgi:hypothetical protein
MTHRSVRRASIYAERSINLLWPIHLTGVVLVGGSPGSSGRRALQARRVATSARWLHAVRIGAEPCLESTRGPRIVHSGTRTNQHSGYSG